MTPGNSIEGRLSRWMAVQTFVGLSAICAAIYGVTGWSFQLKQASEFGRQTELVRHLLQEPESESGAPGFRHKLDDFLRSHAYVYIELKRGNETLYSSMPSPSQATWRWKTESVQSERFGPSPVTVRIGIDAREDEKLLSRLAWTLLSAVVLGSMIVSLTAGVLIRRGLRPLKQLAQETASTGPASPGKRIDAQAYAAEVRPWVGQFNALLERVEQAYEQLESFNADVAHEMRTPLANLISEAEVQLSRPRAPEALRDALISTLEEARRLSGIVNDMLFLADADRGAVARRAAPVSLAGQVRMVAEFYEPEFEDKRLELALEGDAVVGMDVALVRRALSNLISNAIRYATVGSSVRISVRSVENFIWVFVCNDGDPIPRSALPLLFKRFFRAERSRQGSSGHHGLGLAIVAAIARMHGGETRAESGAGLTQIGFSIALRPQLDSHVL